MPLPLPTPRPSPADLIERLRGRMAAKGVREVTPTDARSLLGQRYASQAEVVAALEWSTTCGLGEGRPRVGKGPKCQVYRIF